MAPMPIANAARRMESTLNVSEAIRERFSRIPALYNLCQAITEEAIASRSPGRHCHGCTSPSQVVYPSRSDFGAHDDRQEAEMLAPDVNEPNLPQHQLQFGPRIDPDVPSLPNRAIQLLTCLSTGGAVMSPITTCPLLPSTLTISENALRGSGNDEASLWLQQGRRLRLPRGASPSPRPSGRLRCPAVALPLRSCVVRYQPRTTAPLGAPREPAGFPFRTPRRGRN